MISRSWRGLGLGVVASLGLGVVFGFAGCRRASPPVVRSAVQDSGEVDFPSGTADVAAGGGTSGVGGTLKDASRAIAATKTIFAQVDGRLMSGGGGGLSEGAVNLRLMFESGMATAGDAAGGADLSIVVPISSSAEAYGESRSCVVLENGHEHFVYTAGLDEKNFVPFAPMQSARQFRFSVNKYLCRALAAPFLCVGKGGSRKTRLPGKLDGWRIRTARVTVESQSAAARLEVSRLQLVSQDEPFDYARCAAIAPSNGLCCVGGRTTEWHCGEAPAGAGWHRVSGDCYHHGTEASCTDADSEQDLARKFAGIHLQ